LQTAYCSQYALNQQELRKLTELKVKGTNFEHALGPERTMREVKT